MTESLLALAQEQKRAQWRIGFRHHFAAGDKRLHDCSMETMQARKAFTDANYFHGYHDCHDVHHEVVMFLYFQMPFFFHKPAGHADRWCTHIEACKEHNEPIRCTILPENAFAIERGGTGKQDSTQNRYEIFYLTVAARHQIIPS